MLEGRYNCWQFIVGMPVRVKITEVTAVSGSILLEWVEGGQQNIRPSQQALKQTKKRPGNAIVRFSSRKTGKVMPREKRRKGGKRKGR